MKLTRAKKDEEAFSAKVLVYRIDGALDGLEATNFLSSVTSDMDAEEPNHIVLVCDVSSRDQTTLADGHTLL